MFGTTPTTFGGFGAQPATTTGTGNPKFQVTTDPDPNGAVNHQSITAMQAYNKKSFEELRWEDYQAGKKNSNTSAALSATSTCVPSSHS
jgi:nuclear pore complex protein Nup98-Nup96